MEPLFITVKVTGELLGISPWLMNRLIQSGDIPSIKLGGRRLVPRAFIDERLARANGGTVAIHRHRPGDERVEIPQAVDGDA